MLMLEDLQRTMLEPTDFTILTDEELTKIVMTAIKNGESSFITDVLYGFLSNGAKAIRDEVMWHAVPLSSMTNTLSAQRVSGIRDAIMAGATVFLYAAIGPHRKTLVGYVYGSSEYIEYFDLSITDLEYTEAIGAVMELASRRANNDLVLFETSQSDIITTALANVITITGVPNLTRIAHLQSITDAYQRTAAQMRADVAMRLKKTIDVIDIVVQSCTKEEAASYANAIRNFPKFLEIIVKLHGSYNDQIVVNADLLLKAIARLEEASK